jgi:DNA-binding HxlR family transcriptional regulator
MAHPRKADSAQHDARTGSGAVAAPARACCPHYHEAVELIGRRWTGAILRVLLPGPARFSEIGQAVPELSDRLLSQRVKELEARGLVERTEEDGGRCVRYRLTTMGEDLSPALQEIDAWAKRWLA